MSSGAAGVGRVYRTPGRACVCALSVGLLASLGACGDASSRREEQMARTSPVTKPSDCISVAGPDLQTAIDQAEVGSALCLKPGSYDGPLTIAREVTIWGPSDAVIKSSGQGKLVDIVVEDNGKGMSQAQLQDVFKPFYTNKPNGTGMGMVIARKMMAKMDGAISMDSEEGQGTRVTLVLPASGEYKHVRD